MEFEDWMLTEGLSESTIKKYAGAIDGSLSEWAIQHSIFSQPLRTVQDAEEFAAFSELIEATDIFAKRNTRGNHMYGAALKKYAQYLEAVSTDEVHAQSTGFSQELLAITAEGSSIDPYDPKGQDDAREKVLCEIVRRQGQPKFRSDLIGAYDAKCAITRCPLLVILEAAHITPYLGPQTNLISNGLLLRADLHTLWDLALIAVDPATMLLEVSSKVNDACYTALTGTSIFEPVVQSSRPSVTALIMQWATFTGNQSKGG